MNMGCYAVNKFPVDCSFSRGLLFFISIKINYFKYA